MFLVERFFYIISDIAGLDKEILDVFEKRTYHEKEEDYALGEELTEPGIYLP